MSRHLAQTLGVRSLSLVSHPLCPGLHTWRMALSLSGWEPPNIELMRYEDIPLWKIPPGASLPLVRFGDQVLSGVLPVLELIHELSQDSTLLPDDRIERARIRQAARGIESLWLTMRAAFVAKDANSVERTTTELMHSLISGPYAVPERQTMDWLMLAAAATVITSVPSVMQHAAWPHHVTARNSWVALAKDPLVVATRSAEYTAQFRAFFRGFSSAFEPSFTG